MAPAERPLRVLFLCTGNSCRSQMAEGWARALLAGVVEPYSAGTQPGVLNPLAVRAMAEGGVDIAGHWAKPVGALRPLPFDYVVTVCDDAHESCPALPGAAVIHAPFADPPRLAACAVCDAEALHHYRRVRDQIRAFIESLPRTLSQRSPAMKPASQSQCCADPATCCSDTPRSSAPTAAAAAPTVAADPDAVREQVRDGYGAIARGGCAPSGSGGGGCCGGATPLSAEAIASAIGYSKSDLAATPEGANMGLSCGNPTALASLRPGEVVLDLGSGGGFDCFVAGPKVGATGRVIGVDMTPDMVSRARRNVASYHAQSGLDNVEFRLGEIEALPVADASVDVVISNCVLNLSPDKPRVWREIARVLRPGGRVAVSDLALLRPLPEAVRQDVEALVGCIAGAVLVEETRAMAQAAGLTDIVLTPKPQYIDAMTSWEDPLYRGIVAKLPDGTKPSDYITSLDVAARKGR